MDEEKRYNRQELIEGWNQEALTNATVSIIGSDVLAQYIAIPLAAVGIGKIRIIDDSKAKGEMFLDTELKGGSRARSIADKLKQVNPTININGYTTSLIGNAATYFLDDSNIIIEATNNPRSKAIALDYALKENIKFFSASSMPYFGKIMNFDGEKKSVKYLLHNFKEFDQDEFTSIAMGGMIANEIVNNLIEHSNLESPLYYNLTNPDRFSFEKINEIKNRELGEFSDKKVLMVGAGALGNFAGLGLAKLGVGTIDVIDHDTVEDTNLNRQILYYDSIDKTKARSLSKKIKIIGRGLIKSSGIVKKFTEKSKFNKKYDLILDCVDSFTTRAIINDYVLNKKVPLISGGTDYQAGQVVVYVPGKTSCLDCQMNINELGKRAEEQQRDAGCIVAPNPSVIMTNQIIGGMMVNEARTIFNPEKYGDTIDGKIKYSSNLDTRVGITPIDNACNCKPKYMFKTE